MNSDHSEWTNFTTCGQTDVHLKQEYVHVILYGFSVIALTPAIIIFFAYKYVLQRINFLKTIYTFTQMRNPSRILFSYRVLRVPRIAIHKNLFASLLLYCVSMITFKCAIFLPYIQDLSQAARSGNVGLSTTGGLVQV